MMRYATLVLLVALPVACSSSSTNQGATGGASGNGGTAGAGGVSGGGSGGTGAGGTGGDAGIEAGCGGFGVQVGGASAEVNTAYMVTDGAGAVLVAGRFRGVIDFGGGKLTSPSNTAYDGFLLKLDASGKFLWAKQFANTALANVKKLRVGTDNSDNVYLSFEFTDSVKIAGSPPLPSAGGFDIAVAKLSSTGDLQWAKRYGGTEDESGGVVPHAGGAWSLHGQFKSAELDFGTAGTKLAKANTVNSDAFAASFDSSASVSWSKKYGGVGNQTVYGVGTAFPTDGAAAFMANFAGDLDFNSPANCPKLTGSGTAIGKLSSSGSCLYQVHGKPAVAAGTGSLAPWYAQATSSNGLVLAGAVFGSVDLVAAGSTTPLVSHGDADLALVKLDTLGNVTKALAFGDAGYQEIGGLALDASGNILLAGYTSTTIDFGGGGEKSKGVEDVYIAKLDPDGKHLWSARYGDDASQDVSSLSVGPDGKTVVAGTFAGSIDFGTGSALKAVGTRDLYVAKLCQ